MTGDLYSLATSFSRQNERGGGCAIFIRNNIDFVVVPLDEFSLQGSLEVAGIKIKLRNEEFVILNIYRPAGSSINTFFDRLFPLVESLNLVSNLVLAGDFNIDILDYNSNACVRFKEFFNEFNLTNLIDVPTRITEFSQSCLDNFLVNRQMLSKKLRSGVLITGISDHLGIVLDIPLDVMTLQYNCSQNVIRVINEDNLILMTKLLDKETWPEINNDASEKTFQDFFTIINYYFNLCCPLRKMLSNNLKRNKKLPWVTTQVTNTKNQLIFIESMWVKNKNNTLLKEKLVKLKTYYKSLIEQTKKDYFSDKITNSKNIMKDTWGIVNGDLGRIRGTHHNISLQINGKLETDPLEVSNQFNRFFKNVPESLGSKYKLNYTFKGTRVLNTLFLHPTSEKEILIIVSDMKNSNSSGWDGLSNKTLKSIIKSFAKPLSNLINNSFETGHYPNHLKIAKIIPVYKKKGDKKLMENYRPIALLPSINKVYEKVISNRILEFLESNSILFSDQFGFRKNSSTTTAIQKFIKEVLVGIENGDYVSGIFLDLQKAFDCVHVDILLDKLEN